MANCKNRGPGWVAEKVRRGQHGPLTRFLCGSDAPYLQMAAEAGWTVDTIVAKGFVQRESKAMLDNVIHLVQKAGLDPRVAWDVIGGANDIRKTMKFCSLLIRLSREKVGFSTTFVVNLIQEIGNIVTTKVVLES